VREIACDLVFKNILDKGSSIILTPLFSLFLFHKSAAVGVNTCEACWLERGDPMDYTLMRADYR